MWCDRCSEVGQARLGTDEHGLDCGYLALCESCVELIADAQAHEQELAQPSDPQRDAGWPEVRITRRQITPGHPMYRECYGLRPYRPGSRSWRDVA